VKIRVGPVVGIMRCTTGAYVGHQQIRNVTLASLLSTSLL
jgi:hypothetical protein